MIIFDYIEKDKTLAEKIIDMAKKRGIEKIMLHIGRGESHELNMHHSNIDLFRTTFIQSTSIIGYIGHKKGSISINIINEKEIEDQLENLKNIINSSIDDPANDLAPFEDVKDFESGNLSFSKEKMVKRFDEFIEESKKKYPILNFEDGVLEYSRGYSYLITSNGTKFLDKNGRFLVNATFSSRIDENVSSFNFINYSKKDLSKPIIHWEDIDSLLKQNTEQVKTKTINDKFEGTIIFTPSSVYDLVGFLIDNIKDREIISGTSIYKDKVGELVASDILTIEANPLSNDFVTNNFFTSDGFLTKPITILEKGILKTLLLSYYGSLKTGKPRALNYGSGIIIKGETTPLENLIKSTSKGILLERLSGGEVSPSGDFSAVAKNSYFIENGTIQYPIRETMINGNFALLLKNINGISTESINDGYHIIPYIKTEGATISGR